MQARPVAEWTQLSRVTRPLNLDNCLLIGRTGQIVIFFLTILLAGMILCPLLCLAL